MYKVPRGTVDILPEEQGYWRYVEDRAKTLCQLYGYQRLDTPAFEDSQLFTRGIGEGTDIVTKEMYTFEDRSHNVLALRPEGTAQVCRAYLEHGMDNLPQPVKLYYLATIFRYERPQARTYGSTTSLALKLSATPTRPWMPRSSRWRGGFSVL